MESPARFDGYESAELIGVGGLGRVFRARRISTGGIVAIKEIVDVPQASGSRHRARRELEALLRVKGHPHIVSVEEILDGPNGPCIVMEFLPGGSLAERAADGPLPPGEVVLIGQQVLSALDAAHQAEVIHRDIKPQNIMIGPFGQVKLCDFGISSFNRSGTRTQTTSLTLAYASPEELDGENVGSAADVFSFCATVQHLASGVRPSFRERGSTSIPSLVASGLDPALIDLLTRGQLHDPEARPTIHELRDGFDAAARQLGDRAIRSLTIALDSSELITIARSSPDPADGAGVTPDEEVMATVRRADHRDRADLEGHVPIVDETVVRPASTTGAHHADQPAIPPANVRYPQWRRLVLSSVAAVILIGVLAATAITLTGNTDDGPSADGGGTNPADSAPDNTTTEPSLVTAGVTVLVANAAGVAGAAGRMAIELATLGFETVTPGVSSTQTGLAVSIVYFDPSIVAAQSVAESVARSMGGVTVEPVPTPPPVEGGSLNGSGVLVLLGFEQADKTIAQMTEQAANPPRNVDDPSTWLDSVSTLAGNGAEPGADGAATEVGGSAWNLALAASGDLWFTESRCRDDGLFLDLIRVLRTGGQIETVRDESGRSIPGWEMLDCEESADVEAVEGTVVVMTCGRLFFLFDEGPSLLSSLADNEEGWTDGRLTGSLGFKFHLSARYLWANDFVGDRHRSIRQFSARRIVSPQGEPAERLRGLSRG